MEFDNQNTPVSDDQRRLAESKKLTLQPVHGDVAPEETPDSEIAAHHLSDPAIANVTNDTEQTASLVQPSKGLLAEHPAESARKKRSPLPVVIVAAVVVTCAGIAAAFYFTS